MNIFKKLKELFTIDYKRFNDIDYNEGDYHVNIGIKPLKVCEDSDITKDYLVVHVIKCDNGAETDFQAYTALDPDLTLLPLVDLFKRVNPCIEKCKDKINSELKK